MHSNLIKEKFGDNYKVDDDTYHMGIHYVLGDVIAERFYGKKKCLDTCLGAGFMTISLSKYVDKIVGVDIDENHFNQARYNIQLASIEDKVEVIHGDILYIIDSIGDIDSAFLDPDWAKAGDDKSIHTVELSDMNPLADVLLDKVFKKTQNVCLRLPKSFDIDKLNHLPPHESEAVYQGGDLKFYCIYFGDLVKRVGDTELKCGVSTT